MGSSIAVVSTNDEEPCLGATRLLHDPRLGRSGVTPAVAVLTVAVVALFATFDLSDLIVVPRPEPASGHTFTITTKVFCVVTLFTGSQASVLSPMPLPQVWLRMHACPAVAQSYIGSITMQFRQPSVVWFPVSQSSTSTVTTPSPQRKVYVKASLPAGQVQ
jgi:hypothetical protein